ncbi:hypothetical protein AMTRI_Chr08g163770 [Amborella trichopoda]
MAFKFALLIITILVSHLSSARILDEGTQPSTLAPLPGTTTPIEPPPLPMTVGDGAASGVTQTTDTSIEATAATGQQPISTSTTSSTPDNPLTFFMHDILGGANPSAKPVTGIVTNSVNGQIPFAKITGVLPSNGANPFSNSIPTLTNSNGNNMNGVIPVVTGLGGTIGQVGNNPSGSVPILTGSNQLSVGTNLLGVEFGTITIIDDELTEGHELGSAVVGKAQGFYVASSEDGNSQMMALTVLMEIGGYEDSLSFFGIHRAAVHESHIAVIGGTGKYKGANGYAIVRTLPPTVGNNTDGMETLLEFTVYLA